MPDDHSLLGGLRRELDGLSGELGRAAELRWRLAELELRASAGQVRRLGIVGGICGLAVVVALPLLAASLAHAAAVWWQLPQWQTLLALGISILAIAMLVAWSAWRRFRRQFTGLEQTIEVLREDIAWLIQWTGRNAQPPNEAD